MGDLFELLAVVLDDGPAPSLRGPQLPSGAAQILRRRLEGYTDLLLERFEPEAALDHRGGALLAVRVVVCLMDGSTVSARVAWGDLIVEVGPAQAEAFVRELLEETDLVTVASLPRVISHWFEVCQGTAHVPSFFEIASLGKKGRTKPARRRRL